MRTTLYIRDQGTVLHREGACILVKKGNKILKEVPAATVGQLVLCGNINLTTPVVTLLLQQGIDTVYMSSRGRYKGRLQAEVCGNPDLREKQYERSRKVAFCLQVSKGIVSGKIQNALAVCRHHRASREPMDDMARYLRLAKGTSTLDSLRGYEGSAARVYFQAFPKMLRYPMGFSGRHKRPPKDPINVLLSLGYTLLYKDVCALIYLVGLDPFRAFYHQGRPGYTALASDMMEEFRAPIVDRAVLTVVNKRRIQRKHFKTEKSGIMLNDEGFSNFVQVYRDKLELRMEHPRTSDQISYHQCMEEQIRHLARVLLGRDRTYHPFEMR